MAAIPITPLTRESASVAVPTVLPAVGDIVNGWRVVDVQAERGWFWSVPPGYVENDARRGWKKNYVTPTEDP